MLPKAGYSGKSLSDKLGFKRLQDSFYNGEATAVLRRSPAAAATTSAAAA